MNQEASAVVATQRLTITLSSNIPRDTLLFSHRNLCRTRETFIYFNVMNHQRGCLTKIKQKIRSQKKKKKKTLVVPAMSEGAKQKLADCRIALIKSELNPTYRILQTMRNSYCIVSLFLRVELMMFFFSDHLMQYFLTFCHVLPNEDFFFFFKCYPKLLLEFSLPRNRKKISSIELMNTDDMIKNLIYRF